MVLNKSRKMLEMKCSIKDKWHSEILGFRLDMKFMLAFAEKPGNKITIKNFHWKVFKKYQPYNPFPRNNLPKNIPLECFPLIAKKMPLDRQSDCFCWTKFLIEINYFILLIAQVLIHNQTWINFLLWLPTKCKVFLLRMVFLFNQVFAIEIILKF